MNREKALAYRQRIIDEALRQREMVRAIPLNKLLHITYRTYVYQMQVWKDIKIACKVKVFNLTSIRCLIYAVEFVTHPFQNNFEVSNSSGRDPIVLRHQAESTDLQPLKFQYIKDWEPLPLTHLPLLLNYALRYPRLEALLKG